MTIKSNETNNHISNYKFGVIVGLLILIAFAPAISSAATVSEVSHPSLLFNDISEVPGYQYRTEDPWSSWEKSILYSADKSLSRDFSETEWASYDRITYRAAFTRDLGVAYQITKDVKYAEKAKEALFNIGLGAQNPTSRASAVSDYALAYDWVQPYLTEDEDKIIRDKYAVFADSVFHELNTIAGIEDYITFSDYHGQAYPDVGMAGLVMADFTNPNGLPLQSTPDDWRKAGTDYLFVNDELHSYNRPLISFGFDDDSGKNYLGYYKSYVIGDLLWWFQAYSFYYGHSIFEDYPVAKNIVTSEIWETLPNGYMNNYGTSGNTLETYNLGIVNLFDDSEKGMVLDYIEKTVDKDLLPYSSEYSRMSNTFWYLVVDKYDNIASAPPSWTNHLDYDATYQVFRENWEEDSEWLSLVTFDGKTKSNRDTAHHDQLAIEYYNEGDLLLADAGENKGVLDKYYGKYAFHHNGIAIEDPRNSFPVSEWADSESRGVFKGSSGGITTPVTIDHIVETSWIDILDAKEPVTKVVGDGSVSPYTLSSPIDYTRTIIHNDNDYFVILDRLNGDEDWVYRNVFRPASLNIVPSEDLDGDGTISESEVGHVNGDLNIGGSEYDWLSLPFKSETVTGMNVNSITWDTINPYGNNVHLNMFSVPSSDVVLTKLVGRIGGYHKESEVYSPTVYLKEEPNKELYRITALLSDYDYAVQKEAEEIEVSGNGNAIRVTTLSGQDYFYSGYGSSSFGNYATDADIVYVRQSKNTPDFRSTLINGNYLSVDGHSLIELSGVDLAAVNREGNSVTIVTNSKSAGEFRLYQLGSVISGILKDGSTYGNWQFSDGNTSLIIDIDSGKHEYEVILSGEVLPIELYPITSFSADITEGETPLEVHFSDMSENADAWLWDFGDGEVSDVQNPVHKYNEAGAYTVKLKVSNNNGSAMAEKKDYINVLSSLSGPEPVAEFTADIPEGETPLEVHFSDMSENVDSWLWNFGDGEVSDVQNPVHIYNRVGTYTVTLEISNTVGSDSMEKVDYITIKESSVVTDPPVDESELDAEFTADVTSGSAPLEVHFTDLSSGSPDIWTYYFGDGESTYEQNPVHTFSEPGTYFVFLRVIKNDTSELDSEKKKGYITVTEGSIPTPMLPVADFTADITEAETETEIHFTDASTEYPETWLWNFGDGTVSSDENPAHKYSEAGIYTVTLEASNGDGSGTVEKVDYITITAPPVNEALNGDFEADVTSGKTPLEVHFTDISSGSPDSWSYDFGDGNSVNERNPVHTYTEAGTYTVTLRVMEGREVDVEEKSGYITVAEEPAYVPKPPVADFTADINDAETGTAIHFTDTSTENPATWVWTFGDGSVSREENPVYTYNEAGTYTVTLEVSNADGFDTVEKIDYITITESPVVTEPPANEELEADFTADIRYGSDPLEVHFKDDSTGSPETWMYAFGDGGTAYDRNPVHTYNNKGTYTVFLLVTKKNGAERDYEKKVGYITVSDIPVKNSEPPVADFTADITKAETETEIHFTDASTEYPETWLWNFGDGTVSGDENPAHKYSEAGIYTVTLEVSNDDGSGTVEKVDYITITDPPVNEALNGDFEADVTSGKTPLEVHFTDISSGSPDSWSYDFGDGNSVNERNPVHTYTEAGTYTVTLRVMKGREVDVEEKSGYITVTEEPAYVPKPPVADFTADINDAETGTAIHFTDTSTENPATWVWTFGDGSVSSEENPVYTYNEAGTYTVTLEVSNEDGTDIIEKIDYITITESPVVTEPPANEELKADFTADVRSGTSPLEVHFTDASSGSPETWVYSFGDGRTVYERNSVHTYDKPGKYTVVMVVTKNNGAERDSEMKSEFIVVN